MAWGDVKVGEGGSLFEESLVELKHSFDSSVRSSFQALALTGRMAIGHDLGIRNQFERDVEQYRNRARWYLQTGISNALEEEKAFSNNPTHCKQNSGPGHMTTSIQQAGKTLDNNVGARLIEARQELSPLGRLAYGRPPRVVKLPTTITEVVSLLMDFKYDYRAFAVRIDRMLIGQSELFSEATARRLGYLGHGLLLLTAGMAVYNVYHASLKGQPWYQAAAREVVSTAAAYGLGTLSGMVCGPAALLCVPVGIFLGSLAGTFFVDKAFDYARQPLHSFLAEHGLLDAA